MTTQTKIITIQSHNSEEFLKKVAKLAKRAEKLGLEQPRAELVKTYAVEIKADGKKRMIEKCDFEVTNAQVKIAGFELVGTIDADPVVVNNAPHFAGSLEKFRATPTHCDHCNKNRKRAMTYILQDEAGELVQVGKSCLKDFLGHNVKGVYDFQMMMRDLENMGGSAQYYFSTLDVLATAIALIEKQGFTSASKAKENADQGRYISSTGSDVQDILNAEDDHKLREEWIAACGFNIYEAAAEKADEAIAVLAWVAANEDQSGYIQNLKSVCASEAAKPKHCGLIVSAAPAKYRAEQWEAERKAKAEAKANAPIPQWVGKPGDKFGRKLSKKDKLNGVEAHPAIVATITGTSGFSTDYGYTTIVRFVCDAGNRFTWFDSSGNDYDKGDRVSIAGSLKKHDEYREIKGNILTRCKIEYLETESDTEAA